MIPTYVDEAVETARLNAFYHASKNRLPVGERIEHHGAEVFSGDIVDKLRPKRVHPSRWAHFFLTKDPKCLEELGRGHPELELYEVTPEAPMGPFNWAWLRDTSSMPPYSRKDRERVYSYWAGAPRRDEPCLEEWIAEAMVVDRHLGTLGEYLKDSEGSR